MQSKNDNGDIVRTALVDSPEKLVESLQSAEELGAVQHVIGELPKKGAVLEFNGLMFEVKFVDYKRGDIRMKLLDNYKYAGEGKIIKVRKKDMG